MSDQQTIWVVFATSLSPHSKDEYGLTFTFPGKPEVGELLMAVEHVSGALRDYESEREWPRGRDRFELSEIPLEPESEDAA